MLRIFKCIICDLIHIDQFLRFLFSQYFPGVFDLHSFVFHLLRRHISEYIADSYAHALVTHIQCIGLRRISHLYLYILFLQKTVSQLLPDLFSGQRIRLLFLLRFSLLLLLVLLFLAQITAVSQYEIERSSVLVVRYMLLLAWDYRFYYLFLDYFVSDRILFFQHRLLGYPDGSFHQISHHGIHVSSYITYFRELSGLHLYERRIHQLRQSSGYLCLTTTGRSHHQNIFRRDLFSHLFRQQASPVSVPQRYRD